MTEKAITGPEQILEGWGLLNDAIFCLRHGVEDCNPKTEEAAGILSNLKYLADQLDKLEREARPDFEEVEYQTKGQHKAREVPDVEDGRPEDTPEYRYAPMTMRPYNL